MIRFFTAAFVAGVFASPGLVLAQDKPVPPSPKPEPGADEPAVIVQPTQNPTGIQIGVESQTSIAFPPGTDSLAKAGAMSSADLKWEEARAAYLKILEVDERNPLTLSNLGAVEFRLGNLEKAAEYLDLATREAPKIAQNWLTLGLIHYRLNHSNLAISCLTRALHEDPGDPRAHNYLGVVIRERGWTIGAETELQRAVFLDPGYADAHYNLAIMYLDKTPPSIELARRHYFTAVDYGAEKDPEIEEKLKGPDKSPKIEEEPESASKSDPK